MDVSQNDPLNFVYLTSIPRCFPPLPPKESIFEWELRIRINRDDLNFARCAECLLRVQNGFFGGRGGQNLGVWAPIEPNLGGHSETRPLKTPNLKPQTLTPKFGIIEKKRRILTDTWKNIPHSVIKNTKRPRLYYRDKKKEMLVCLRCAPFWFFQPLSTLPFFPPFFQYFIYSTFFHSFFPIFAFQATFGLHSFSRYDHKGKKLQAKKTVHQYYSFILCTIITFFCIQKMIILVERERE